MTADDVDAFEKKVAALDARELELQEELAAIESKRKRAAAIRSMIDDFINDREAPEQVEPAASAEPDLDDMEPNDKALFTALNEAAHTHPGKFLTESELHKLASEPRHGFVLSRISVRNRMKDGATPLATRYADVIEDQKHPLAWRMVPFGPASADESESDPTEPEEKTPVWTGLNVAEQHIINKFTEVLRSSILHIGEDPNESWVYSISNRMRWIHGHGDNKYAHVVATAQDEIMIDDPQEETLYKLWRD